MSEVESKNLKFTERVINGVWNFFSSLRLTVFLLLVIVALCLLATIIPQISFQHGMWQGPFSSFGEFYHKTALNRIYHSAWLTVPLVLLVINCLLCLTDRWSRRRKAFILVHVGLLVLLLGGMTSSFTHQNGEAGEIPLGEPISEFQNTYRPNESPIIKLPFQVEPVEFKKDFYPPDKIVIVGTASAGMEGQETLTTFAAEPGKRIVFSPKVEKGETPVEYQFEVLEKIANPVLQTEWKDKTEGARRPAVLIRMPRPVEKEKSAKFADAEKAKASEKTSQDKPTNEDRFLMSLVTPDNAFEFSPDELRFTLQRVEKSEDAEKALSPIEQPALFAVYKDGRRVRLADPRIFGATFTLEGKKFEIGAYYEKLLVDVSGPQEGPEINPAVEIVPIEPPKTDEKKSCEHDKAKKTGDDADKKDSCAENMTPAEKEKCPMCAGSDKKKKTAESEDEPEDPHGGMFGGKKHLRSFVYAEPHLAKNSFQPIKGKDAPRLVLVHPATENTGNEARLVLDAEGKLRAAIFSRGEKTADNSELKEGADWRFQVYVPAEKTPERVMLELAGIRSDLLEIPKEVTCAPLKIFSRWEADTPKVVPGNRPAPTFSEALRLAIQEKSGGKNASAEDWITNTPLYERIVIKGLEPFQSPMMKDSRKLKSPDKKINCSYLSYTMDSQHYVTLRFYTPSDYAPANILNPEEIATKILDDKDSAPALSRLRKTVTEEDKSALAPSKKSTEKKNAVSSAQIAAILNSLLNAPELFTDAELLAANSSPAVKDLLDRRESAKKMGRKKSGSELQRLNRWWLDALFKNSVTAMPVESPLLKEGVANIGVPVEFGGFLGFGSYYLCAFNDDDSSSERYSAKPEFTDLTLVRDSGWPIVVFGIILTSLGLLGRLGTILTRRKESDNEVSAK